MTAHHRTLGVPTHASMAEIDAAYAALARRHHPDAGGDEASFCAIQSAHSALQKAGRAKQAPVGKLLSEGERECKTLTLQRPDGSVQRQQIWLRGSKEGVRMLTSLAS